MPISWSISCSDRLVVAICRDKVTRTDVEGYLDNVVVGDALPFAKIFDVTMGILDLSDDDMMLLGARIRAYSQIANMGPLALVAPDPENYDRLRMYTALAGADRAMKIFTRRADAERWLAAQANTGRRDGVATSGRFDQPEQILSGD